MRIEIESVNAKPEPVGAYAMMGDVVDAIILPKKGFGFTGGYSYCVSADGSIETWNELHGNLSELLIAQPDLKPIYPGDKITLEF